MEGFGVGRAMDGMQQELVELQRQLEAGFGWRWACDVLRSALEVGLMEVGGRQPGLPSAWPLEPSRPCSAPAPPLHPCRWRPRK